MVQVMDAIVIDELLKDYPIAQGVGLLRDALRAVEHAGSTLSHPSQKEVGVHAIALSIRIELHKLLCTNSKVYVRERRMLAKTCVPAVSLLTGIMVGKFGIPAATASAVGAALLLVPLKLGVNAWCALMKESPQLFSYAEKRVLADMAEKN
jgi:hypothetical protein